MIHHIEINVSNLEESIDFWGWLLKKLGYSEFQRWPKGISWRFDQSYIVFVQTESDYLDIPYHRKRTGLNHIAFHAKNREHVDQLTSELRSEGIKILYSDRHPFAGGEEHYAVFFEDPDRIKVEIAAPSIHKS